MELFQELLNTYGVYGGLSVIFLLVFFNVRNNQSKQASAQAEADLVRAESEAQKDSAILNFNERIQQKLNTVETELQTVKRQLQQVLRILQKEKRARIFWKTAATEIFYPHVPPDKRPVVKKKYEALQRQYKDAA